MAFIYEIPLQNALLDQKVCACVRACVCMCACACACVRACVRVCVLCVCTNVGFTQPRRSLMRPGPPCNE